MRILVTGASGFLGRHFVQHATAAGHEIVALQRKPASGSPAPTHRAGVTVRYADLLDRDAIYAAVADADCVCHLAAAFREAHATDDYFHRVNVEGTATVMAAAHAAGVKRFVFCSTAGIYGKRVPGLIDETRQPQPWNSYERSKVAAEEEVRRSAAAYGMEYVILRPSSIYGPGDRRLAKLYRNAARGRFPLFGRGEGRRHMVYVRDLAEAFLRACALPAAANREMIVAGPKAVPLHEILRTLAELSNRRSSGPQLPLKAMVLLAGITEDVCRLLKVRAPLHRRRMDFYLNDAEYDCRRAEEVLAWKPKVSLREGLQTTLSAERKSMVTSSTVTIRGFVWLANLVVAREALETAQIAYIFL
ncbi:MAG: NAD(P)-dependent oxidoreductase [Woeseia sp.]